MSHILERRHRLETDQGEAERPMEKAAFEIPFGIAKRLLRDSAIVTAFHEQQTEPRDLSDPSFHCGPCSRPNSLGRSESAANKT